MPRVVVIGAVLYDPKVAVIWDIIRDFFDENGCPIDTIFYTNYTMLTDALLRGQIDIAWNSPLAWIDAQRRSGGTCRAIAMRDTDRNRNSFLIAKRNSLRGLEDLRGKTVAVGSWDSPQATLIPLALIRRYGLEPGRDFNVKYFNVLVGKHGDHVGGELEAFKCLENGKGDVCALLDLNWKAWSSDGTIDPSRYSILATTDDFDHCVFTVRHEFPNDLEKLWLDVLFSMSYGNPRHREMMDMEGLREWLPGRTTKFAALMEAVETQRFFEKEAL